MVNIHKKEFSAIRGIQMQATIRYHSTPTRMTIIKEPDNSAGEVRRTWNSSVLLMGIQSTVAAVGKFEQSVLQWLELQCNPVIVIPFTHLCPRLKIHIYKQL